MKIMKKVIKKLLSNKEEIENIKTTFLGRIEKFRKKK